LFVGAAPALSVARLFVTPGVTRTVLSASR
jgi:hypothetical protein